MSIGKRLRQERERLGLTQELVANAGQVSRVSQSNYEAGRRIPDVEYLGRIAALGIDLHYIATGMRQGEPVQATGASARLREERERLELSLEEMARAGNITAARQADYENNKRSPDTDYLELVAAAGVDVGYVITGEKRESGG